MRDAGGGPVGGSLDELLDVYDVLQGLTQIAVGEVAGSGARLTSHVAGGSLIDGTFVSCHSDGHLQQVKLLLGHLRQAGSAAAGAGKGHVIQADDEPGAGAAGASNAAAP